MTKCCICAKESAVPYGCSQPECKGLVFCRVHARGDGHDCERLNTPLAPQPKKGPGMTEQVAYKAARELLERMDTEGWAIAFKVDENGGWKYWLLNEGINLYEHRSTVIAKKAKYFCNFRVTDKDTVYGSNDTFWFDNAEWDYPNEAVQRQLAAADKFLRDSGNRFDKIKNVLSPPEESKDEGN